ncbi:MAG: hypothetical protein LBB86_04460 [Oscillospiraceae bacterium]|jgi:hypothetical protein|nr:hypothetical protein [Oscillospiraceae bacterium]
MNVHLRKGGANPERYESAVRRWFRFIRKEPNALITGSLLFWLISLPVVTIGPARLALVHYMDKRDRGEAIRFQDALRFAFRTCGGKAWLMGASDALALLMAGGCALAVQAEEVAMALRAFYAILFILDMTYAASGLYRYSALSEEPRSPLTMLAARGFLMTLSNPGWTALFWCVQLMALIICAATGVGLILLFPAAAAMMEACAYDAMASAYATDEAEEDEPNNNIQPSSRIPSTHDESHMSNVTSNRLETQEEPH